MTRQVLQKRRPPKQATAVSSIEERFSSLTAQFETLKAQIRQAQQTSALGLAAATFAHEVNNLLTPIQNFAKTAIDANDPEFCKRALDVTIRNVDILIDMSAKMLEIGAAKSHKKEKFSVRKVVNEAFDSLCRNPEKDGIKFPSKVDESVFVLADPLQFRQILFNLFLNAHEAMAANHSGMLVVSAKLEHPLGQPPAYRIEVRNTGPAIAPEILPNIFDPFKTSKPVERNGRYRCGGLGLALVRNLVQDNGGTIEVASDEVSGTSFFITLPAAE